MKTTAFLIRVLICFLLSLIPLKDFENQIYSARMNLRGQWGHISNPLILDLAPSDFTPAYLQRLLAKKPAAILVTWYIPNEIPAFQQSPDEASLMKNPKLIWSASFDADGDFLRPLKKVTPSSHFGFNNPLSDPDGIIRRSILTRQNHVSLTLAAYLRVNQDSNRIKGMNKQYLINFLGPSGTIPSCSLSEVFSEETHGTCTDLQGKILLLTQSKDRSALETFEDTQLRTPLGQMSRAEILANEINTVVNHKPIYWVSFIEEALIILAMIFLSAFYIIYYPVLISAIAVTGTGIAIVAILFQIIFMLFDIYIPSANIGGSLLITYLVFTGYRLAFQENLQWRSLKQAQYLREVDQMKANFLSLISHDLKTPLAKIQAMVERLRREAQLPVEQRSDGKEYLDSIENSNNELKHYITSILNLSKIESQKVILNKKSNDINRIIQHTLKRLRPLAQQKNLTIEEKLEPLFSVECDEDLIHQVLTNLVDNAIKFSPASSKIVISSREEEGFIHVDVEDSGPGIPKDQLPLMFRKFNRFLRPMKEQVKGTGLGLYLSKYFLELHGGSIQVRSKEGKGTIFSFSLPIQENDQKTIQS